MDRGFFTLAEAKLLDPCGVYGMLFHYAITIALVGSAFILFIYCWYKGRLDMDESPKMEMLLSDEERGIKKHE